MSQAHSLWVTMDRVPIADLQKWGRDALDLGAVDCWLVCSCGAKIGPTNVASDWSHLAKALDHSDS